MFYSSNFTGGWTDSSSVAVGYSPIEDTLRDGFTKTQAVIAQQIFLKAMEQDDGHLCKLNDEQMSTLMKNFASVYWDGEPKFTKRHVLCNMETLDCHIYENMQDAFDDFLEGFVYCFDVTY
jgi:hypothetical protein